ncbi:MAG TPA: hypothetical protein VN282_17125 [Pyrinomonadaceae bacterium]|nr:hypothetical protein [Pyrinomonadaceae bacterium]
MSEARRNPFPGLRPFKFHERKLFFGREEQYEQMACRLDHTRFLAVVGTSGSGKSSLVRAGLLPALYGGLMSAGTNWRVALFRPKDDPIRELALALNHRRVFGDKGKQNGSSLFTAADIVDWHGLCAKLNDEAGHSPQGPSGRVLTFLSPGIRQAIAEAAQKNDLVQLPRSSLIKAFNDILTQRDFYQSESFKRELVKGEVQSLLSRGRESLSDSEVERLNRLLLEAAYPQQIANESEVQTNLTEATLRRGDLGLVEAVCQASISPEENLLVVVDQFEELFRYAKISEHGPHGNQAAAFVKLLLQARAQTEIPIYVVLTMRSDYLGDCAKFWDLPEAINDGQYLIPRLTHDQRREAIRGPVRVRGAEITPQLVNQLLNDMGNSPDQLPILQHALMRTWDKWEEEGGTDQPIDIPHYDKVGRMAGALSRHAEEAYAELPDARSREVARKLFKCLTEKGPGDRESRRPTTLREIRAVTDAKVKEIVAVANVFRREGRSFLMPSAGKPLGRGTSLDISHESLIRNWDRLKRWVNAEAKAAHEYRRLAEAAILHEKRGFGLWKDKEVQDALKWQSSNSPNAAWASRYHADLDADLIKEYGSANTEELRKERDEKIFDDAISFLEKSRRACEKVKEEKKRQQEEKKRQQEEKERQRKRQLRVTRVVAAVLLALCACAVASAIAAYSFYDQAQDSEKLITLFAYANSIDAAQAAFTQTNYAKANELLESLSSEKYKGLYGIEWYSLSRPSPYALDSDKKPMTHRDAVLAVAFMRERNAFVSVSADGVVKRLGKKGDELAQPEQLLKSTSQRPLSISLAEFSPDGKILATVDGNRMRIELWDLSTGEPASLMSLEKDIRYVLSIALSPDEKLLVGTVGNSDGTITIRQWNTVTGEEQPLPGTAVEPTYGAVAYSVGGKIAVGSYGGGVGLWDGNEWRTMLDPRRGGRGDEPPQGQTDTPEAVNTLAFSGDGNVLASLSNRGWIKLWHMDGTVPPKQFRLCTNSASWLRLSSDGTKLAVAGPGGSVAVLDTRQRQESVTVCEGLTTLQGHIGAVRSVAFVPGEDILATASDDGSVRLWDFNPQRHANVLPEGGKVSLVAFSPDGKKLAVGSKTEEGKQVVSLNDVGAEGALSLRRGSLIGEVSNISFSPDNKTFSTYGYDGTVELRNIDARQAVASWKTSALTQPAESPAAGSVFLPSAMAFSPEDGRTLAVWNPKDGIRLYDTATRRESARQDGAIPEENLKVSSAAFSPDLKALVLGCDDGTVRVFSAGIWRTLLWRHASSVYALAFSRDERLATGSADMKVMLWNANSWDEKPKMLEGHAAQVTTAAFSSDGKRLVTGSSDVMVKIWDVSIGHWDLGERLWGMTKRRELATMRGPKGAVLAVALSPDGHVLAVGSADGTVRLW